MEGIELGTGFRRGAFGGGFGGLRRGFRLALDDYTLQQVAMLTDAEYYLAESAEDLLDVFADVPSHLVTAKATTELSAVFTAVGALLALIAVALALRWQPISYRVPAARGTSDN